MELNILKSELEKIKEDSQKSLDSLKILEVQIKKKEKEINSVATDIADISNVNKSEFIKFFEKPYVIIPQNKNSVLVAVPKFIKDFQVGWLWKETEQYYIYQLNQYSAWLGDIPEDLKKEINLAEGMHAIINGDTVTFDASQKDIIKKKLWNYIDVHNMTDTTARIRRGHEFDVIAEIVESGSLPFKPNKVDKLDIRAEKSEYKLRKYQQPAFDKFLEVGAIGLFHPTGAGKSMIAMKACDIIKGKKLIIVPSKTLIEQWKHYIETYIPHCKDEIEINTYQWRRQDTSEYALVIYDECQRLPANTFSRLSLIKSKYRIGLSASPHREDGRESYIFALTGFPIGLNWQLYMKESGRSYHQIYVHIVKNDSAKIRKVHQLINTKLKTLVFCDRIDLGKSIARELNAPFVYGASENRLETIDNNMVTVVSRVADLGISIKDLNRIIEVDFLFGSRQQELQRTGRLMHSLEKDVRHDIIMTEKEIQLYGKRLWALQEKGFHIKVQESNN